VNYKNKHRSGKKEIKFDFLMSYIVLLMVHSSFFFNAHLRYLLHSPIDLHVKDYALYL